MKRSGAASGHIRFKGGPDSTGFGHLAQYAAPADLLGKRVRFTFWVRSQAAGTAAPWVRIDSQTELAVQMDTLRQRRTGDATLHGMRDWTRFEVVLDVPKNAFVLFYGLILEEAGEAWMDDVTIEPVDEKTPSTNIGVPPVKLTPEVLERGAKVSPLGPAVNLDFEN